MYKRVQFTSRNIETKPFEYSVHTVRRTSRYSHNVINALAFSFVFHACTRAFDGLFSTIVAKVGAGFYWQYPLENNESLSVLSFVPSIDDDGKYLTCRAENLAIPGSALEDKWRLDVQYQPVVTLKMGKTLNPDDIKEGDDVYFECSVRANPKVYKLAWFKDVCFYVIRP